MVLKAQRGVEARRDAPPDDVEALHELRIAYKKLRYAVEIFAPALPADLAAMAEPAARFQKRLGEIHDIDVAKMAVRRARGLDAESRVRVLFALDESRARKLAKYVAEMSPAEVVPAVVGESATPGGSPPPRRRAGATSRRTRAPAQPDPPVS
jgi:CHAD domain-containing protein